MQFFSTVILFSVSQLSADVIGQTYMMLKLAARRSSGETERRAKRERISVVDRQVVHGVFAVVGVVVAAQQTIDLGVDEQVVPQSRDPGFRHARRTLAGRTTDCSL